MPLCPRVTSKTHNAALLLTCRIDREICRAGREEIFSSIPAGSIVSSAPVGSWNRLPTDGQMTDWLFDFLNGQFHGRHPAAGAPAAGGRSTHSSAARATAGTAAHGA